jgi:hypothetical protein
VHQNAAEMVHPAVKSIVYVLSRVATVDLKDIPFGIVGVGKKAITRHIASSVVREACVDEATLA